MNPRSHAHPVFEEIQHQRARYLVIGQPMPRPGFLTELSTTELQVMQAWLSGLSMREIAGQRNVAVRTVANQVASLYRKCGVGSRNELQARLHGPAQAGVQS